MIPDPAGGNSAILEDGRLAYAVRGLPLRDGQPRSSEELREAPIIGWAIPCDHCGWMICMCAKRGTK